jgi:hypothetical protein
MGFAIFVLLIIAAILVTPWFLVGCVVLVLINAFIADPRRRF